MKISRDIYRPSANSDFECFTPEGVILPAGVEIFINKERCSAMFFSGRRSKPDWHYRFKSVDNMNLSIKDKLDSIIKIEQEKKAKKAWAHSVLVGDIFYSSWGYEQTNINYYEVIKLIGKTMVEVQEVKKEESYSDNMTGQCVPMPGIYKNDDTRRLKVLGGSSERTYLKLASYEYAYKDELLEIAEGVKVFKPREWTSYY